VQYLLGFFETDGEFVGQIKQNHDDNKWTNKVVIRRLFEAWNKLYKN